ncbi:MAG: baseplate J/gp47 family protein [Gammaproteobacteria bacterium]|nr:baseplate J/gp47 family protein [Gammaproteobacteria bacterium]
MPTQDRLSALCALGERTDEGGDPIPSPVTGIDFIHIVDPGVQTLLQVFFIINPDLLEDPLASIGEAFDPGNVRIVSTSDGTAVEIVAATWIQVNTRTVLEIETAAPGDFSLHRLTIDDDAHVPPRVDPFFNDVVFSFKQGCPSVLDCRGLNPICPTEPSIDFPIDYLARDFSSLRGALLDFAAQRYPQWSERVEADAGAMLAEVMAAMGDEFSYIQDRYAREAHFETATQRRSLHWHTRLIDYPIDYGRSATTYLALRVGGAGAPGTFVPAGTRVWAASGDSDPLLPFEIGGGLRDQSRFWVHNAWDEIQAHVPDPAKPCLPAGSTTMYLVGQFPQAAQLPVVEDEETDDDGNWVGRLVLLKSAPEDPSLPERRHLVHITDVSQGEDQICLDDGGNPIAYTRITWDASEALPFELFLPNTTLCANVLSATAGETFEASFVVGTAEATAQGFPAAVERQGPLNELAGERTPVYLFSLPETERRGLGWLGTNGPAAPELEVTEFDPDTNLALPEPWEYQRSLLNSTGQNQHFSLDAGTWRPIFRVERPGRVIDHVDYASGDGFTLRFGDGEFGRLPPRGTGFHVRYRTDVGTVGNVPADTVTIIADPDPNGSAPTLAGRAQHVTNPLPITSGVDPQPAEVVKQLAPEAYRAVTFRAVRDEDYREHAERLEGVQRAGARARWTGSWLTESVTADPLDSFQLSEELRTRIAEQLDCVRQVGREVVVKEPRYLNLDLEVEICVEPFAYPGQVQERVVRRLTVTTGRGAREELPFFHPDYFTFGLPLQRADLEAAVQAVPGVRGVLRLWIRARGVTERREFSELVFPVADDVILRVQNDPRFPERGSLKVIAR